MRGCGPYHETVTVAKPLTLIGASITGDNTRSVCLAGRNTHDLVIAYATVVDCKNATQQGAIDIDYVTNITVTNSVVTRCTGAGISIVGGASATVSESHMSYCAQEGFHGNTVGGSGWNLISNQIHHNGGCCLEQGGGFWETGAGKIGIQDGGLWENNEVYSNIGPGLWCDISCRNITIRGNRVHHNTLSGIFYEISWNGLIENNSVWANGRQDGRGWCWPPNILVSSSRDTEVRNNTVAWAPAGITVIHQDRGSFSVGPATGLYVHDNVIVNNGDPRLLAWCQNYAGTLYTDPTNRGANNRYWSSVSEPQYVRFEWSGSRDTLSAFNATPGEEGGAYLTTAQRDAALINAPAGPIPLTP